MLTMPIDQVPKEIAETVAKVRVALLRNSKLHWYAHQISNTPYNFTSAIPTACTDGKSIWYNPKFLATLDTKQYAFLMLHELGHITKVHALRKGKRDHKLWNIACDYAINIELVNAGFKFIKGGLLEPKYKDMSSEQIYDFLKKNEKKNPLPDLGDFCDLPNGNVPSDDGSGSGGTEVDETATIAKAVSDLEKQRKEGYTDSWGNTCEPMSDKQAEEDAQELQDSATIASEILGGNYAGSIPAGVLLEYHERMKPKIPWTVLLRKYMFAFTNKGRPFYGRLNRKSQAIGVAMPTKKGKKLGRIDFAIDVSGSVNANMFSSFVAEVANVFRQMKPDDIGVIQFDTRVKRNNCIKSIADFRNIQFTGGGGTSVEPVMQEVKGNKSKAVIVLTDGFFDTKLTNPSKPVLWVVYDNPTFVPPFGNVVHFKLKDLMNE